MEVKSALFHMLGNFPLIRHSLKMLVSFFWVDIRLEIFNILLGMSSIGDGLLIDWDFIALRMSSLETNQMKVSSLEYHAFLGFYYTFIVFEVISNTRYRLTIKIWIFLQF